MLWRESGTHAQTLPVDRMLAAEPSRPAPLGWPTAAVLAGTWLSEGSGIRGTAAGGLAVAVAMIAFAALLVLTRARGVGRWICTGLLLLLALAAGFARHQAFLDRPARHVAHALRDEGVLTRVAGIVVASPFFEPGLLRNPFLPFDPPGRTQLVAALREFRVGETPTPVTGRVRVTVAGDASKLRLGDYVELTGRLYPVRGPQNPGEVDWARWSRLQGVDGVLSVEGPQYVRPLEQAGSWPLRVVAGLRAVAQSLLLEPYAAVGSAPPESADADEVTRLLDTLVLGQRSAASAEINHAFLSAGATHYLAVSGFNVSLLAGACWWLARRVLRASASVAAVSALVVIVLFALVAEPNAPILRAAIGGVLAAMAALLRRPMCLLNWLALSALCIVAYNPLELFRPGFQLSFVEVLALLTLTPAVYRFLTGLRRSDQPRGEAGSFPRLAARWVWRAACGLAVVSGVAWTVGVPLVLLHFRYLSAWGALGSFVLCPLVIFITVLSFAAMLVNLLLPPAGHGLLALLHGSTSGLLAAARSFELLPGAVVETPAPPAWLVALSYALLAVPFVWPRSDAAPAGARQGRVPRTSRRRLLWLTIPLALGLLWGGWALSLRPAAQRDYGLVAFSVGNGNATLLTAPGEAAMLIDAGTDRNADAGQMLDRALHELDVRALDGVVVSHSNFDHCSGVPTLLRQIPARCLWLNRYFQSAARQSATTRRFFELLPADCPPIASLDTGVSLALGQTLVEVLWPPVGFDLDTWPANDSSLVLRWQAGGRTVLIPGDIERAAIRALLAAEAEGRLRLACDVLIAPHHGSVIEPETALFLAAANPEVVIVSSAADRPKFARVLREAVGPGCRLLVTGEVGAVQLRITPGGEILCRPAVGRAAAGAGHR